MTRLAGLGLFGALAALLVMNAITIAEHGRELRPHGAGDTAPEVALRPIDPAGPKSFADLRGRVVLVDFWATWCGPCRHTMPALQKVYEKYKDRGLEVVSVNIENDAVRASSFAAAFKPKLTFPLFVDAGPAQAAFRVDAIPHLVLIDKDGRIAFVHVGGLSADDLDEQVGDLVK
jgi:thiol-disulfide isomerase/thioredoxin